MTSYKTKNTHPRSDKGTPRGDGNSSDHSSEKNNKTYSKPNSEGNRQNQRNGVAKDPAEGKLFAALDLGTNNCRLLIVTPDEKQFRVVDSFSRIVRLGEGLEASGRLSEEAMERTISALKVCARKIRSHKDIKLRCVATEACRDAHNGKEFIDRVLKQTRLRLDIIGGRDEAELAAIGCGSLFDRKRMNVVVFDIGGGSTELTRLKLTNGRFDLRDTMSTPLGVVRLAERYDSKNLTPENYATMVDECRLRLKEFFERQTDIKDLKTLQLLGTSGTITTLAAIQLGMKFYDRSKIDGCTISRNAALDVIQRLVKMNHKQLTAYPCIGEERADLVLAGCAVFEALLDYWPVPMIKVADRGLRDGILLRMIRKEQRKYKPNSTKTHRSPQNRPQSHNKEKTGETPHE